MENTRAQKSLIFTIFKGVIKKLRGKSTGEETLSVQGIRSCLTHDSAASFIKGTNTTCKRAFY